MAIQYLGLSLDTARLCVSLMDNGDIVEIWLDYEEFKAIRKAEVALKEFRPFFPERTK
jgi:hypothetical protein